MSEVKHLSNSKKKSIEILLVVVSENRKGLKIIKKKLKKCKSHFFLIFLSRMKYVSFFSNNGEPPSKPSINVSDSVTVL